MVRTGIPGRTNGNQSTELSSLNEISRKLNELKLITAALSMGGSGGATLAEQQAQTALLTTIDAAIANIEALLAKSKLETMKTVADDMVQVIKYLDAGNPVDRRVDRIDYSSVSLGLAASEVFGYGGGPGDYYVNQITLI